jgi:hypothetical protein
MAKPKQTKIELEKYTEQFVALVPTEKDKYHEQGVVYKVHPDVAKRFVAMGMATEAPEGWEEEELTDKDENEGEETKK